MPPQSRCAHTTQQTALHREGRLFELAIEVNECPTQDMLNMEVLHHTRSDQVHWVHPGWVTAESCCGWGLRKGAEFLEGRGQRRERWISKEEEEEEEQLAMQWLHSVGENTVVQIRRCVHVATVEPV